MAEKSLDRLRTQTAAGEFEFSQHALRRMVERNIADEEIRQFHALSEQHIADIARMQLHYLDQRVERVLADRLARVGRRL